MPNHVHLVLATAQTPLDRFMQSLQQSYTQRFNARYGQVGHVFQSRYKAFLCETDAFLLTLVRYVHQNPVRAGLAARAEDYPYSGHRAYLGGVTTDLVDPTFVLNLVGGTSGYVRLIASDPVGSDPGVASPGAPPPRARRSPRRSAPWLLSSSWTSTSSGDWAGDARRVGPGHWPPTSWSAGWAIA